jgi:arginine decarboxylase
MQAVDKLRPRGRLDIIKLIHFHLGSQITDIRYIKSGLQEVARFYAELRALGVDVTHVDVGGGLGVDYDGTNSTSNASVNYSLQEYANDVVYTLARRAASWSSDAARHQRVGACAHGAPRAAAAQGDRRRVRWSRFPVPELSDDDHAVLHEMWRTTSSSRAASSRAAASRRSSTT